MPRRVLCQLLRRQVDVGKVALMLLVPLSGEAACRRNVGGKEYQFIVLLLLSEQIKNILASL
jgi:hypothetical protein